METYYKSIQSPIGTLHAYASETAILGIFFQKNNIIKSNNKTNKVITQLEKQLKEYFLGMRKKFNIPLKLKGTSFQIKTWKTLLKIPYGQTITYKEQGIKMSMPKSSRAIGSANGKNLFPIIIPCHRVISSSGSLGGYSGGLSIKKRLLKIETEHD